MELRIKLLRGVCACAVAVGIAMVPVTGAAQDKPHHPAKKHKISHAKKKTHNRVVRHIRIHKPSVEPVPPAPSVSIEKVAPPVPSGPVAGTPYDEAAWRGFHSDWNGQYHYNGGKYYYDEEFKYPAQIPNDFNSIASRFGGPTTLEDDPTLIFSGDSGEPYPILEYNADRTKPDKKLKLKCAYFGRAYFWRDGSRYDRKMVIDDKGARCFQFVKHA